MVLLVKKTREKTEFGELVKWIIYNIDVFPKARLAKIVIALRACVFH